MVLQVLTFECFDQWNGCNGFTNRDSVNPKRGVSVHFRGEAEVLFPTLSNARFACFFL